MVEPTHPRMVEPNVEAEPASTVLEPLAYFKLKTALLEIVVQEGQLREQAAALQQRKVALFAGIGLPLGMYQFNDERCTVERPG